MEKKLKRQRIVIIILSVALIYCFIQFKDFKAETESRFNNLSHQYNNLNSTIDSIYNNVDKKLEEQASLITYFDFQYGELDSKNLKVPVSVKIIPKTATASTKLTLDFGSRTVEMKKGENMEYTADFKSDLFLGEGDEMVNLIISEGNTTKSEELDWYISSLHDHFLPNIFASFIFDHTEFKTEKGLYVDGDVMFHWDTEAEKIPFNDLKLVYKLNGEILEESEIPETVFDSAVDTVDVKKTYPDAKEGDTFEVYLEGTDEYGFVHRTMLKSITCTSEDDVSVETDLEDTEVILDKDGNILYGGKK